MNWCLRSYFRAKKEHNMLTEERGTGIEQLVHRKQLLELVVLVIFPHEENKKASPHKDSHQLVLNILSLSIRCFYGNFSDQVYENYHNQMNRICHITKSRSFIHLKFVRWPILFFLMNKSWILCRCIWNLLEPCLCIIYRICLWGCDVK